ncbi:alpha/beta family hydrolase, partial [Streptomyces venezuelae]|uniref:alpha/beta family hydrolase n=1 Tax=Streptomyces venezuelae TaxID=54571 RepID=UPI00351B3C1F
GGGGGGPPPPGGGARGGRPPVKNHPPPPGGRTGRELGAAAVLALSFPLHPPGRPERSRAEELLGTGLPTLVVQGGNDPFGRPGEFPAGPYRLVEIPYGDHGFALPKRAPLAPDDARELLVDAVAEWILSLR